MNQARATSGIVEMIQRNGVVFVREDKSKKLGFIESTTPIAGHPKLRRGLHLSMTVRDEGNVMVVESASAA